jgi:Xaa-Pro aminopeptidase
VGRDATRRDCLPPAAPAPSEQLPPQPPSPHLPAPSPSSPISPTHTHLPHTPHPPKGCELDGYASDVTRTWPVSGRFSGAQRDAYELVLHVHRACLQAVRPGASIRRLHELSVRLLCEGIHDLRLMPGLSLEQLYGGAYRRLYWHSVGHYLGMDTHDTGSLGHDRTLEASAVITIEPGLYVPDEPAFGPFRGIGVRIEDDVLVTQAGAELLSCDVPVEAREVEALVQGGGAGQQRLAYHAA